MDISTQAGKQISREWAMPSHETFTIAPIRKLIDRYINGDLMGNKTATEWIDPFCRQSVFKTRCKYTNDLNPAFAGTHTMDALDFLKQFDSETFDGVLFDPPFSAIQAKEEYKSFGAEADTCRSFWADRKREAARILKAGGIAICCGWTSLGLGKVNNMEMIEVLLVNHGQQNDTIVTVERKCPLTLSARAGALLIILLFCACREDESKEALLEQGYTNINLTGPVFFGCDQNDWFRNGFVATSPAGIRVKGTACAGLLKNWTIRTEGRATGHE